MGRQPARVLEANDLRRLIDHTRGTRHPERNAVIVLLSFKAGLRACEISGLTWAMALKPSGRLAEHITIGIVNWFHGLYADLGLNGCSSHSGRRTFITRSARIISKFGGSLRDVQELAGHRALTTTERYIEGDRDAQRKLIGLI